MQNTSARPPLMYDAEAPKRPVYKKEVIPTRLIYAMFGLAFTTLMLVTFATLTDRPLSGAPEEAPIVAQQTVTLAGIGNAARVTRDDGTVILDTELGGFVAVIRSGLETARHRHQVEGNPPVTITAYENGRLSLTDPATGWQVELSSFGQGNRAAFERLFTR